MLQEQAHMKKINPQLTRCFWWESTQAVCDCRGSLVRGASYCTIRDYVHHLYLFFNLPKRHGIFGRCHATRFLKSWVVPCRHGTISEPILNQCDSFRSEPILNESWTNLTRHCDQTSFLLPIVGRVILIRFNTFVDHLHLGLVQDWFK